MTKKNQKVRVEAADFVSRIAFLSDGTTVPITHMLDEDREETDDPAKVYVMVCGSEGRWFTMFTSDGKREMPN